MSNSDKKTTKNLVINRIAIFTLGFYFLSLLLLFFAELGLFGLQDYLRATNQVLLLLALLILPFLVLGLSRFIQTLTIKFSGQELHIELVDLRQDISDEVERVETQLSGQVSTAEQALWPILAGYDINSDKRLAENKLIIGTKQDTSQLFFAHYLRQAIKEVIPEEQCEIRFPNGGSLKNFADTQYRWTDIYIDYTGTCCQYFNINHRNKSDEQIIEELNYCGANLGLKLLKPLGASEDYCLVMSKQTASKYNITSIRDLKIAGPNLILSADPEFLNRNDCYLGLQKYGVEFKSIRPCMIIKRYELLEAGEADVFVGYETDPQLHQDDIVRLEDPDQFFPRYMAIPVVSTETLNKIPGLESALLNLHNSISTEQLIMAVNKLSRFDQNPSVARDLAVDHLSNLKTFLQLNN